MIAEVCVFFRFYICRGYVFFSFPKTNSSNLVAFAFRSLFHPLEPSVVIPHLHIVQQVAYVDNDANFPLTHWTQICVRSIARITALTKRL